MVKKAKKPAENVKKSQNVEEKVHELEQELQIRIEDNAELYRQLCNFKNQLKEAHDVIKEYSKLENLMNFALGIREKGSAQKYLEKWGVK